MPLADATTEIVLGEERTPKQDLYPYDRLRVSLAVQGRPLTDWNSWSRLHPEDRWQAHFYPDITTDELQPLPVGKKRRWLQAIRH